jgi:mannose-1-phosphate guanylyltransferase
MITVIIAGGSGTRLWPLSTSLFPKHLLKLVGEDSMLQATFKRAKGVSETIYVITEAGHATHVKQQLPELSEEAFIIEPGRRGTAHCIVMALDYIARHNDHNEPISFIHADHHVRDIEGFVRSFETAGKVAIDRHEITLIGIEPSYPATGFGYIERDGILNEGAGVYGVESFKEKPDFETAKAYLATGRYLWNCGYFVGSISVFVDSIKQFAPDLGAVYDNLQSIEFASEAYKKAYLELDVEVIDVALIEKVNNLAVVAAGFDWIDVGSFKDLHDVVEQDENGNYFRGEAIHSIDTENVYVRNEETKPIAVIGLDNVIVVNTPDGIVVARKDLSSRVGEISKKLSN